MADMPDILRPLSPRVLCVVCCGFLGGVKYFWKEWCVRWANAKPINLYPVRIIDWHCPGYAGHAGHMLGQYYEYSCKGTVSNVKFAGRVGPPQKLWNLDTPPYRYDTIRYQRLPPPNETCPTSK